VIPPNLWPWRTIGKVAAPVLVLLVAWWSIRSYADRVADAREAEVRGEWAADEAEEKRVADAQTLKNQLEDAADEARNAQVAKKYADDLAAAAAGNARLERMLRQATAAASAGRAGQGADIPGAAPAGPQGGDEPPAAGAGIHQLIADALTEARMNADQLDAVLSEIRPQM
jgi:hypothetical protein